MSKSDGLNRLLDFLNFLESRATDYRLDRYSPESITVTFSLVGYRIEAYFEPDSMHYSIFKGDESIETDFKKLMDLIEERSR